MRKAGRSGLGPLAPRLRMGEQRQVRRGEEAARIPQGLAPREGERGEGIGGGEAFDRRGRKPGALAQGRDIGERPAMFARGDEPGGGVFGEAVDLAQTEAEGDLGFAPFDCLAVAQDKLRRGDAERRRKMGFTQRRKGAKGERFGQDEVGRRPTPFKS